MRNLTLAVPALALALASCAPTAGIPPVRYIGESSNIIATIAQTCTQMQPNKYYNFYTVDAITTNGVTCVAKPVLGFQLLVSSQPIRLTFTALQNGQVTNVAGSVSGVDFRKAVDDVFQVLDKSFQRAP